MKITLNDVGNLIDATTAKNTINANSDVIEAAFDNTLSRDGSNPNQMGADLDMNGKQILNLPNPRSGLSPLRLQDLATFNGGGTIATVPSGGVYGQALTKDSNTNFDIGWNNVLPTGGSKNQTLSKFSTVDFDVYWKSNVPTNIMDYGAVPNINSSVQKTANTTAILNAWAASSNIYIPAGIFYIDPIVVPLSARGICGDGNKISIISGTPGDGVALISSTLSPYLNIRDIGIELPVSTSVFTSGLSVANTTDSCITRVRSQGSRAFSLIANINLTLQNWVVDSWYSSAVYVNNLGTGSGEKIIDGTARGNIAPTTGGHPIFLESSLNATVDNNFVTAANGFGITASSSVATSHNGIKITNNRVIGNKLEAITLGGNTSDFEISGNVCSWTAGQDFGMSFQALLGQRVQNGSVSNNVVDGSGAGAIALVGDVHNVLISNNSLLNYASPTRAGYVTTDSASGISITGVTTYFPTNIRVSNNYLVSATGFESYTIGEFNAGTTPNSNIFTANDGTTGATGFYKILGAASKITLGDYVTVKTAPTTPASGQASVFVDSTSKLLSSKNDAGSVSSTIYRSAAVSGQFVTGVDSTGTLTRDTISGGGGSVPISSVTGMATGVSTFLVTPTSANLAAAVTDETGTGGLVFRVGPTLSSPLLVTPDLGTPTSGVATNLTGTASGLTAGNVTTNANLTGDVTSSGNATTLTNAPVIAKVLTGYTSGAGTVTASDSILSAIQKLNGNDATNANLTGPITSAGNATSIASQTGTGTKFVVDASPTLTGTPLTPTAAVDTNTTQIASTAFVLAQAGSATPVVDGTGTVGTSTRFARQDHIHPTDTSRAATASPTLTGTPLTTTAAVDTNTTQIASTAFVLAQAASATPVIDGTAAVGTSTRYARGDHVHPTDTTRAAVAGRTSGTAVSAGNVGEVLSTIITLDSVSMTTVTATNVGSISLTAGDWDVQGVIYYLPGASTVTQYVEASLNTTSATRNLTEGEFGSMFMGSVSGNTGRMTVLTPVRQINVSSTTTVYLVGYENHTISTMVAGGKIFARRRS